jgi:hypothetical protein
MSTLLTKDSPIWQSIYSLYFSDEPPQYLSYKQAVQEHTMFAFDPIMHERFWSLNRYLVTLSSNNRTQSADSPCTSSITTKQINFNELFAWNVILSLMYWIGNN